jgi:PhoPQ-activated pathogenicity-related protein
MPVVRMKDSSERLLVGASLVLLSGAPHRRQTLPLVVPEEIVVVG